MRRGGPLSWLRTQTRAVGSGLAETMRIMQMSYRKAGMKELVKFGGGSGSSHMSFLKLSAGTPRERGEALAFSYLSQGILQPSMEFAAWNLI